MLGFFGIFGRSRELRHLDEALHGVGLHPRTVPEAVKLTTVKLIKESMTGGTSPRPRDYAAAAALLGYCASGRQAFVEGNGENLAAEVEARLTAALDVGDSLDARLVLLALHAGFIQESVVVRYGLEIAEDTPS
jgi:hypothetical protein